MERRRPGPPRQQQERDAAIIAAVSGGASIIGTAREFGISESRVRFICRRALAAAEDGNAAQVGGCCERAAVKAEADVWRQLADTARHRRRDCECQVCGRYRSAVGM